MKISRIARDIGQRRNEGGCRFPLPIRTSERALRREPVLDSVSQDNQFDIDFLLIEARKLGYVVYVDQEPQGRTTREVLYFGPPDERHPGVPDLRYELKWGISLIDFSPKLSTANQVSGVEIRGWNRSSNRAIRPRVTTSESDLRRYNITTNTDLLELVQRRDTLGLPLGTCREREERTSRSTSRSSRCNRPSAGRPTSSANGWGRWLRPPAPRSDCRSCGPASAS